MAAMILGVLVGALCVGLIWSHSYLLTRITELQAKRKYPIPDPEYHTHYYSDYYKKKETTDKEE